MMTTIFSLLRVVNFIMYFSWFAGFGIAVWGAKKTAKKGYVFIAAAIAILAAGEYAAHHYRVYAQRVADQKIVEMELAPENREAKLRAHQEIQRAVIQAYEKENLGEIASFYISPGQFSVQIVSMWPGLRIMWSLFAVGLYLLVKSEPRRDAYKADMPPS